MGTIITLYKGNGKPRDDPNSYRGLTLLPIIFKVFEMIFAKRLEPVLDCINFPNRQQSAYQKGLCSLLTSFNLQECIQYNLEREEDVYVAFLDSNKAFDTVWHDGLLYKLNEIGITSKSWHILKAIYTNIKSSVVFNGFNSRRIRMERDVLQGSALSAKMYLVFINGLLESIENCGKGALIVDLRINIPTQADDICLISTQRNSLQYMLKICELYSKKWRFTFSAVKSKIMCFSRKRKRKLDANPFFSLQKYSPSGKRYNACWYDVKQ